MRKLFIDTNVLLLWVVGTFDSELITRYRRTAHFSGKDYRLLLAHRQQYGSALTSAPVLTEMSNLFGNDFHREVAATLVLVCNDLVEVSHPKGDVLATQAFERLGYADTAALLSIDDDTTLLTDDVSLYLQALTEGRDAINFNHIRTYE